MSFCNMPSHVTGRAKYDWPVSAPSKEGLVVLTLHGCSVKWELCSFQVAIWEEKLTHSMMFQI